MRHRWILLAGLAYICACQGQTTYQSDATHVSQAATNFRPSRAGDLFTAGYVSTIVPLGIAADLQPVNVRYNASTKYLAASTELQIINASNPSIKTRRIRFVSGASCLNHTFAGNGSLTFFVIAVKDFWPVRLSTNSDDVEKLSKHWRPDASSATATVALDPKNLYALIFQNFGQQTVEFSEAYSVLSTTCGPVIEAVTGARVPAQSPALAPSPGTKSQHLVPTLSGYYYFPVDEPRADYNWYGLGYFSNATCISYQLQVFPQGSQEIDIEASVWPLDKFFLNYYGPAGIMPNTTTRGSRIAIQKPKDYFSASTNTSLLSYALGNKSVANADKRKLQTVIQQKAANQLDPTKRYVVAVQNNLDPKKYRNGGNDTVIMIRQAARGSGTCDDIQFSDYANSVGLLQPL